MGACWSVARFESFAESPAMRPQRSGQPAGAGHFALGEGSKVALLHARPRRRGRVALGLCQRGEDGRFREPAEIAFRSRRVPFRHVRRQRRCKRFAVAKAWRTGSISLALHRIDRKSRAEGQQVQKRLLRLFKAPARQQLFGMTGNMIAQVVRARSMLSDALLSSGSRVRDTPICRADSTLLPWKTFSASAWPTAARAISARSIRQG